MKTVPSVYTFSINPLYLSNSTQLGSCGNHCQETHGMETSKKNYLFIYWGFFSYCIVFSYIVSMNEFWDFLKGWSNIYVNVIVLSPLKMLFVSL